MSVFFRIILVFSLSVIFPLHVGANSQDTTTILLFGDSIIAGYGVEKSQSLPSQLQSILDANGHSVNVIGGGVSGDTTSGGRSRLDWTLKKHQPDIVVLALGGNDLLRGVPPKVTRQNISAMLDRLKLIDATIILSQVQAPASLGESFQKDFDGIYTDAAESYKVPLYPFFLVDTFGNAQLMQADGIHPNPAGAKLIATKLAAFLEKNVLK